MKVHKSYNSLSLILLLLLITELSPAQPGNYYPPPSSISYQTDTLTINPPDSLPGDPVILMGYNIYVDDDFYDNVMVTNPLAPVHFYLDDESLLPGERIFCVDAVYNDWISEESACDTALIIYGYELPFYEDWSSFSLETLQWTTDSDHWVINSEDGNPAPSVSFLGEPGLTDYEAVLESYPINAVGLNVGRIMLDFSLKLEDIHSTNNEELYVQIWNSSNQNWTTVAKYSNENGSTNWVQEHLIIRSYSMNKVFKIRFQALGENSADISSWSIDNIHVYRYCIQPVDLELEEGLEGNVLNWTPPVGPSCNEWIHWDDGVNSGNSIGTGGQIEFDVAARWDAQQIASYDGDSISIIAFFPAEESATYNVRMWTGSGPDTMVVDQFVPNPSIGSWNYITLDKPLVLDVSKDLWIGYHVLTPTGYPAGVDDGPAIDGYGNMMYFEGEWKTLLEINNELDFNWNIAGIFYYESNTEESLYHIYRQVNQGEFELYDISLESHYLDTNIVLSDYYCYNVTEVYVKDGDTCESGTSETSCEIMMLGTGETDKSNEVRIYPNPTSTFLNIESPEKISEVRIYNVLGKCVLKMEIGNLEGKVDVSGLENGIYFVEVMTEKMNFKDKILVFR